MVFAHTSVVIPGCLPEARYSTSLRCSHEASRPEEGASASETAAFSHLSLSFPQRIVTPTSIWGCGTPRGSICYRSGCVAREIPASLQYCSSLSSSKPHSLQIDSVPHV